MAARTRARTDRMGRRVLLRRSATWRLASAMLLAAPGPGCAKVDEVPYCSQATEAIRAPSDAARRGRA